MIVVICEVVVGTTEGPTIGIPDGLSPMAAMRTALIDCVPILIT